MRSLHVLSLAIFTSAIGTAQVYNGALDGANCSTINGWGWDSTQPNTAINVDLFYDNIPMVTVPANLYRSDLSGFGNGYHAFSISTPSLVKDGVLHQITAYASGTRVSISYALGLTCRAGSAGYIYYQTDNFASINTSKWTQNGFTAGSSTGLTSSDANGGSTISTQAVPAPSTKYEVKMSLKLATSGGVFVSYLRASSDAQSGPNQTGTWYVVELQNPTFSGSTCTGATLVTAKRAGGAITVLSSSAVPCHDGMTMRTVFSGDSVFNIYLDNVWYGQITDASIASGQPGVGVRGAPVGNAISRVDLGQLDTIAPYAVDPKTIVSSSSPTEIDLRWKGTSDDPNGSGICRYDLVRNGAWVNAFQTPEYTDNTVSPSTTYAYTIIAYDCHSNGTATSFTVTTPAAGQADPRRVGVRSTGTYWGGGGEQIDMRSGNLNYSAPLFRAEGRGGWDVTFGLSYNSQNWRQDSAGTWQLGTDVGYGYGWKLQAGSLTPYWSSTWFLDHWIFTDGSGAEYRLDVNNNGVWSSKESVYLYYDSNTQRLYFTNGSFWVFGCSSSGAEQDAGARYPTLMQDSNGNQILVRYSPAVGMVASNTSSRIQQIEDVRATLGFPSNYTTYNFVYNTDAVPHLTNIQNTIGTGENYNFSYSPSKVLYSPDAHANFGQLRTLESYTQTGGGLATSFAYDASMTDGGTGELVKMTMPLGGYLRWAYSTITVSSQRSVREVQSRYLAMSAGAAETVHQMTRDSGDSGRSYHLLAYWADLGANAAKEWWFQQDNTKPEFGLQIAYEEREYPNGLVRNHIDNVWSTNNPGNSYIAIIQTTLDPNQPSQVVKQTRQTVDDYGNITRQDIYDYGNPPTLVRSYEYNYLRDSSPPGTHPAGTSYNSRYILNRLLSATVTQAGQTTTLLQNQYDYSCCSDLIGVREHDAAYSTTMSSRGNLSQSVTPSGLTTFGRDVGGNATIVTRNGVQTTITQAAANNYSVIAQIASNSLSSTRTWNSFHGLQSETGANSDTISIAYDAAARPQSTTSPYGATTTFTYVNGPPAAKIAATTINGNTRWTRTTMDGWGRTIKVEAGSGSFTSPPASVVDTVYGPCGCSPLGKLKQVSRPYAPGASVYWTNYAYDAAGRTVNVVSADGLSATTYVYSGNSVAVTDPSGTWKRFTSDAMGNLLKVTEPDPAGGSWDTTYTYDALNHLTSVPVLRGSTAQPRTYNYGAPPGAFLLSETNPETGTASYTYNADRTLATKIDAKGQVFSYDYDYYQRPTAIKVNGSIVRSFGYDANLTGSTFGSNLLGRLAYVVHAGGANGYRFTETFSYLPAGAVTGKRLEVSRDVIYARGGVQSSKTVVGDLDVSYSYNTEGKMAAVGYPDGSVYTYKFDPLGRPNALTDSSQMFVVSGVSYGPANELLGMAFFDSAETRHYNTLGQIDHLAITGAGAREITYTFPAAGTNNGHILSQTESGETVQYHFDVLSRLTGATGSGWGQTFQYDRFGNLTNQIGAGGAQNTTLSTPVDSANNRLTGYSYDNNGNLLSTGNVYDSENRLVSTGGGSGLYFYDAANKRIYQGNFHLDSTQGWITDLERIYVYGVTGQRMGSYSPSVVYNQSGVPQSLALTELPERQVYFGTKLLVARDRLGSQGKYYPYGQERNSPQLPNDQAKFATYTRDSSGLDYADQRYYSSQFGRFISPDTSGRVLDGDPQSWNKYAYAAGDPINHVDPNGLFWVDADDWNDGWWDDWFWWDGIGVIGGGGGGVPTTPLLGPDPNWKTPGQVTLKVALWDAAIAAALAAEQQRRQTEPAFRYVAYLSVVGDCYRRQVISGGSVVRERTYEVVDEFGKPYAGANLTITEHNYVQSGSLGSYGSTWHVDSNGEFVDFLSRGGGDDATEFQQFTASNAGGLNSFGDAPVTVYDPSNPNGPFFGTLGIVLRQHAVFINGSDGKINGQLNYCP